MNRAPSTYRLRAAAALGRALKPTEHVHHHSETQLVICTRDYHAWLHRRMRVLGIPNPRLAWRDDGTVLLRVTDRSHAKLKQLAQEQGRSIRAVVDLWLFGRVMPKGPEPTSREPK
jgi:hypothetical protein